MHDPTPSPRRLRWSRYAIVLLAIVPACTLFAPGEWQARVDRGHPLVGRVWDVGARRFITPEALVAELDRAPFVLLGEKHDNPDHHRLQARVVQELSAAGRRPAVAFEMLSVDVETPLASALARPRVEAADVRAAVAWDESGWPRWALYAPLFESVLRARLPIVAADLPAATVKTLRREGRSGLAAALAADLALDEPLAAGGQRIMADHIRRAHCGYAPDGLVARMVDAQRARDAHLARRLLEGAETHGAGGAVLIAGIEHVRRDVGVPAYLARWAPDRAVAAVGFVEVARGHTGPEETLGALYGDTVPLDYASFTPRVDDDDPCAVFAEKLERLRPAADTERPPS
jgi:uncharacterized iron-regulated protein